MEFCVRVSVRVVYIRSQKHLCNWLGSNSDTFYSSHQAVATSPTNSLWSRRVLAGFRLQNPSLQTLHLQNGRWPQEGPAVAVQKVL